MHKLGTIIRFTYQQRVKQRSFLITTIITLLLITGFCQLPTILDQFKNEQDVANIGLVGVDDKFQKTLTMYMRSLPEPGFTFVSVENESSARQQVLHDDLTGYLVVREGVNVNGVSNFQYKSMDAMGNALRDITTALNAVSFQYAMDREGLSAEQTTRLLAPVQLETLQITREVNGERSESEIQLSFWLVYVLVFLIYYSVISTGTLVATEVTAEKSSRVMELLVSSVSPLVQLWGKILAICMLGLSQLMLFMGVAWVNVQMAPAQSMIAELRLQFSSIGPTLVTYMIVFYMLGYLVYATIFAAIGSLVSRTEEVQQTITPVVMLLFAAFVLAMFGLSEPHSPVIVGLSFVPFFAPFLMFLRIGMSSPAWWEIASSMVILVASIYVLAWLAAKIYRVGVLMYGKKPSLKELYRAMRTYEM